MTEELKMAQFLDFEKPLSELENQIEELKNSKINKEIGLVNEIDKLKIKFKKKIKEVYSNLTPWERVQLSRHPDRPHAIDYINNIIDDFHEVHGDRKFGDDKAIICGFGYIDEQKVAVIGIEKGRKTKDKISRNFGMPRPEGYRKALRVMKMASKFSLPVVTLVDTPGAYPGIGAEERGQSQAIADNLVEMFNIKTPILSIVIGEGGSGGALGIAIADTVCMLEYSIYSVISPESCASILWADPSKAELAANALKLTPAKAKELGVIDKILEEPEGGAHRDKEQTYETVKKYILKEISSILKKGQNKFLNKRYEKFRKIGNETIAEAVI
jgi:acetyl-CoA carboxylase carboxyl transferase subunit alpha